jgi:hypothetical protein
MHWDTTVGAEIDTTGDVKMTGGAMKHEVLEAVGHSSHSLLTGRAWPGH